MPAIRIISWNIMRFASGTSGVFSKPERIDRVMEVVHPKAAGAAAECDIFVIIEPVTGKQTVGTAATGKGVSGGTQLLGYLNGRGNGGADWQMAPALCTYSGKSGGETLLVFYRTPVVTLKGAPALLNNVPGAVAPNWRILNVRESCPYHVTFTLTGTTTDVHLIAQHAPSPSYGSKNNGKANHGVRAVGAHVAVTGNANVVYLGDLNLCSVPSTDTYCDQAGHADDRATLGTLLPAVTPGMMGMNLIASGQRSSLKAGDASQASYRLHAYDNILAKGSTASSNTGVIDLVDAVLNEHLLLKPGPIPPSTFGRLFKLVRSTAGRGLSDHLPVKATITF